MDKAAMYESMMESMQTDALFNLYSGIVTPVDRQVLADMPLPSDMVDPFASQDVDPLSVMNLTYVSLSGWIADAKQEKYYTERFVNLSKLVMKGVATMCRGLVTLHQRGEDLSAAPMQIGDLISVGSYHLRKSYLGVVQFSAKHPEIGERLLLNQLCWSTTLLRLYKTKEKLAKPISNEEVRRMQNEEVRMKNEELSGQDESPAINAQNEKESTKENELPDGNDNISSFLLHNSSFGEVSLFGDGFSPLAEPGAFSALRAYTSLDGSGRSASGMKTAAGSSASLTGSREAKTEADLPKTDAGQKEISKEARKADNAAEKTGKTAADGNQEKGTKEQINRSAENETEKNKRETAAAGNQEKESEKQIKRSAENKTEKKEQEPLEAESREERLDEQINDPDENESEKPEPELKDIEGREGRSEEQICLLTGSEPEKHGSELTDTESREGWSEEHICLPAGNDPEKHGPKPSAAESREGEPEEQINRPDGTEAKTGRESKAEKEACSGTDPPAEIRSETAEKPGPAPGEATDPPEGSPEDPQIPGYLHILQAAFARSAPSDEGSLTFSYDEIRYLAADPDFAKLYPDAASEMQKILLRANSG
jgi:hypothetical protein